MGGKNNFDYAHSQDSDIPFKKLVHSFVYTSEFYCKVILVSYIVYHLCMSITMIVINCYKCKYLYTSHYFCDVA